MLRMDAGCMGAPLHEPGQRHAPVDSIPVWPVPYLHHQWHCGSVVSPILTLFAYVDCLLESDPRKMHLSVHKHLIAPA